MELVTKPPEELRLMADAMPPVVDEGGNEVGDYGAPKSGDMLTQLKERPRLAPSVPGQSGENDDRDLSGVDQGDAGPPALRDGEFVSGPHLFNQEKECGDASEQENHAPSVRRDA